MLKHPLFWLGLVAFALGLAISLASCGISYEGAAKWTGLAIAGILGAAMSPAQVVVSAALGFARSRVELLGMIGFLLLLCAGDGFTSFQGFEARSADIDQQASDRNARYAAAAGALPGVDADIAVWRQRFDAMQAGLAADATADAIKAAQGFLILCVPGAYTEKPDGRLGPNTLAGMRQCSGRANEKLDALTPERNRLQAIVEAGAETEKKGTTFWERIGLSGAMIFFSNVLAIMAGAWIARAKDMADQEEMASSIDAMTGDLNDMNKFYDELITKLAA